MVEKILPLYRNQKNTNKNEIFRSRKKIKSSRVLLVRKWSKSPALVQPDNQKQVSTELSQERRNKTGYTKINKQAVGG
jgi:hypothetical protein